MHDTERQHAAKVVLTALDPRANADLAFMEDWERDRPSSLAAVLRAGQIRRTNPDLAAAVARAVKDKA